MAARLGFARSRQVGARRRRKIGSDRVGGAESRSEERRVGKECRN